jgi:1-acyl-sn-glycerol-3-phosphate acyltransferase
MIKALLRSTWGVYCWATFCLLLLLAILAALLLPRLDWRRDSSRFLARLFFRLAGLPLRVSGLEQLPERPCVAVANHASYIDGPLLYAVLPSRFGFVIKKEIAAVPLAGLLLRRLGHEFVDRHNHSASARDARRILKAAVGGGSVAFFPEGTFTAQPGLARFHSGAFVTASRAEMPVVPIVIRGARAILPADTFLPRCGALEVEILQPVAQPRPFETDAVARMKREARERIVARVGEPDLEAERES